MKHSRYIADNEAPSGISPTTVYKFEGESVLQHIDVDDPEMMPPTLTITTPPSEVDGIHLLPKGLLAWPESDNFNITLDVVAQDDCGLSINVTLDLIVLPCPCENGGNCRGVRSGAREDGHYVCDCVRPYAGKFIFILQSLH